MPGNPSPAAVTSLDRRLAALEMRKAGVIYENIATALGYSSKQAAWRAVQQMLKEVKHEGVESLRVLEGERLDTLFNAAWEIATDTGRRPEDRLQAITAGVRVMDRRARLLGLDAPTKTHIEVQDMSNLSDDELRAIVTGGG